MTADVKFSQKMNQQASTWPAVVALLLLLLPALVLAGCAGKLSRTEQLLATDYPTLTDDDLQLYYYQLEDQIIADERSSARSSFSIGFGTGGYGSRGSLGMSTGVGVPTMATDLRNRRNEVRLELQKRGVTPVQ